MGFSEGGGVASFLLIEDARRPFGNFRCAIFFSSAAPFDPDYLQRGIVRSADRTSDGIVEIKIPTAHMWSSTGDESSESASVVARMSAKGLREEFVHDLGHDIPGAKSDRGLSKAVRIIEHTIEKAKAGG